MIDLSRVMATMEADGATYCGRAAADPAAPCVHCGKICDSHCISMPFYALSYVLKYYTIAPLGSDGRLHVRFCQLGQAGAFLQGWNLRN